MDGGAWRATVHRAGKTLDIPKQSVPQVFCFSFFGLSVFFFLNLRLTEKSANSLQSSFFLNHLRLSCQHDVSSSLDNLLCIFLKIETFSYTAG